LGLGKFLHDADFDATAEDGRADGLFQLFDERTSI
jgi:hypothetical protein